MSACSAAGPIWTYWEDPPGARRSAYLDLCLETLQRHAGPGSLRVVGRETVGQWLPELDLAAWNRLPAANLRSDYLRSRLLYRYGGVWTDVDVVALAPLAELLDGLRHAEVAGWGIELGRFYPGLCAARPAAAFVAEWIHGQDEVLAGAADWDRLSYRSLGPDLVWGLARRHPWHAWPARWVAPIPWYQWRRFLSRLESPGRVMRHRPVTVGLWNAAMGPSLARQGRAQLLGGSSLLSRLLRIGLGLSTPPQEDRGWARLHLLSEARFTRLGQAVERNLRRPDAAP